MKHYIFHWLLMLVMLTVWVAAFVRLMVPDACVHPLLHIVMFLIVLLLPFCVVALISEEES